MFSPQQLIGKRVDGMGHLAYIDDFVFTVAYDNGTVVTYPLCRLVVDNLGGNLRVRP